MSAVLPADRCAAAPEIAVYLKESVGNATRIDYGTGNTCCCFSVLSSISCFINKNIYDNILYKVARVTYYVGQHEALTRSHT